MVPMQSAGGSWETIARGCGRSFLHASPSAILRLCNQNGWHSRRKSQGLQSEGLREGCPFDRLRVPSKGAEKREMCYNSLMVSIDIDTPRPTQTLVLIAFVAWLIASAAPAYGEADGTGSGTADNVQAVVNAEGDMRRLRERQEVIAHREEILRAQLELLDDELMQGDHDPALLEAIATATERLKKLLADKRETESELLATLQQIWEAQGEGITASRRVRRTGSTGLTVWPVAPKRGISAYYHDPSYENHFGVAHEGIDIPVA